MPIRWRSRLRRILTWWWQRPTIRWPASRRIPVSRLAREPFIVREKGSDTWNSMEEAFGEQLAKLNIAMEIRSTETIKQAVMAGMGVSFLSAHTISRELHAGSLSVLNVQGFPLMLNWYVVHRRSKRLPPVAQAFKSLSDEGRCGADRADDRCAAQAGEVEAAESAQQEVCREGIQQDREHLAQRTDVQPVGGARAPGRRAHAGQRDHHQAGQVEIADRPGGICGTPWPAQM